jgi:hypothetical protein
MQLHDIGPDHAQATPIAQAAWDWVETENGGTSNPDHAQATLTAQSACVHSVT